MITNNLCPWCNKEFEGEPYFCNFCGKPLFIGNSSQSHFPTQENTMANEELNEDTIALNAESLNIENDNTQPKPKEQYSNMTSRYSETKIFVDSEYQPNKLAEKKHHFPLLHTILILLFMIIIGCGISLFLMYDKRFDEQKNAKDKIVSDSIKADKQSKINQINRQNELEDSLRKSELELISKEDSIENIRRYEEWQKDSIVIDGRMSELVKQISSTNIILAKYQDYNNCVCYFVDSISPIFKLACFDGNKNEVSNILIDNIQCKLIGHFLVPDAKSFIVLCKDDIHDYGMAYKINMSDNTVQNYQAMDDNGNKCYDIGLNRLGFYMKYGKGDDKKFTNLYTVNYDKYGNFIDKE